MMEQQNNTAVMMIEFGVSRQPESYQSVRCQVTMPVFVQPGDNVANMLLDQMHIIKATVRAQVDDEYERGHDKPAPYSSEPRFTLLVAREAKIMVLVPADQVEDVPEAWRHECHKEYRGHRLGHILEQSGREYRRFTLVDCSDGDWSNLPPLEPMTVWKYRPANAEHEDRFWVIVRQGVEIPNKKEYPGWWNYDQHFRVNNGAFWEEQVEAAHKAGAGLFDCTDGAFDFLPQPVKPGPEEEREEAWEDTDDDDGDN